MQRTMFFLTLFSSLLFAQSDLKQQAEAKQQAEVRFQAAGGFNVVSDVRTVPGAP